MNPEHMTRQSFPTVLRRALRNRCPVCGEDAVFDGLWRMRHHCHGCRYTYEREQGYFLGAMYINYGLTCLLGLALFFAVESFVDWPPALHLTHLVPFAVAFPLLFFRYSRLLWMLLDVCISVPRGEDFLPPADDVPVAEGDSPDQL